MICVSIGRGRHKQMIAEHRHLVEQGAELVELRLDYIRRAVNLKRLLARRPCPVIATCRREQDGGKWEGTEEARLVLLRTAIVEGVDYVDLEEDVAAGIPRFGPTKRIISYHNFQETPIDLQEIHERMQSLDPDIIKLATMAHNPHDNLRMMRLVREAPVPTVGLCMGDIGTPTRILCARFGAPFTYATFHQERSLAPGQLSYKQMRTIYDYDRIDEDTEVYGVIADPIGHSLSPMIHNAAFQHLKLNKVYVPFRVPREDLSDFLRNGRELGLRGLSVTIPHKEHVVSALTKADSWVRGIGAANTMVFKDGEILGYNTDCKAALDSVVAKIGNEHITGRPVLILGAGGVAKAIAHGLKESGAEVMISARNTRKAAELASMLGVDTVDWSERHNAKFSMLVNGTPVGMHPDVDESPFDRSALRRTMIVFDTVYNPEQTLLIKSARERECRTITGMDMFVRQAAMQFKLFTGEDPPIKVMMEAIKRTIGAARQ